MRRKNIEAQPRIGSEDKSESEITAVDKIQTVLDRAQLRLLNYDFRSKLVELTTGADSEQLQKIIAEAKGEISLAPEAAQKILSDKKNIIKSADEMIDITPLFSQLSYATIAKAQQASGEDYSDNLRLAQEIKDSLKSETPKTVLDFNPDAIMMGILQREINQQELPDLKSLAVTAMEDPKLFRACALALSENQRDDFLSYLPASQRRRASLIWDKTLSGVLNEKYISETDIETRDKLRSRTASELNKSLSEKSEQGGIETINFLSETVANLNDEESRGLLESLAKEVLTGKDLNKNNIKIIKIIRQLSKIDSFTGNGLMMKFLGQEGLEQSKFDYLLRKIHEDGFLSKNLDQTANWSDSRLQNLLEFLKKQETDWQDEANVLKPFEHGVKIFGLQKMFKYAGRQDISRHDALFAFDGIIDLYHESGQSPEKFFGDILNQVYNDSSSYEEGSSYHHFNSIVNSLDLDNSRLAEIKTNASRFKIKELQELTENYDNKKKILASWINLKNYVGLLWILEQGEILEELQDLEKEGQKNKSKQNLAKFIKTLAFHRDSKVEKSAIIEFWRKPDKFLARMDNHTPEKIQNGMKPSNYLEISHLDLTGDELRDALVGGDLDKIQVFPIMEAIYEISFANKDIKQVSGFFDTVRRELGSFKENTANKPLFNEVRKILNGAGIKIIDLLEEADENKLFASLSAVELQEVKNRIMAAMERFPNLKINKEQTAVKKRYRAKVNLKSDPQAILAGNDTACCMPFGSGKNNIYMFNPNCGLFTLEEEKGGGEWRTIAQSVLTLDIDAGKNVVEIATAIQEPGRISDILPDKVLEQKENFLACDNIEVAGNAQGKEGIIREIYRKFFEVYLEYYNKRKPALPLNNDKLIIGQGNSDVRFGQSENNTFLPAAPVGYSDKLGHKVDALYFKRKEKTNLIISEQVVNQEAETAEPDKKSRSVSPLTFRDALAVALMEDKVYGENQSLMYHLDLMENSLIAKDINNSIKKRPNLSLKFNDKSGRLRAYLLSYEGRSDEGKPLIYVSDLASDRQSKIAGGSLIFSFLDNYKEAYLDKGNPVPVLMEAREGTSYDLVQKNINKISQRLGRKVNIQDLGAYSAGQDRMHRLLISV